jgi:hypothetical protein
VAERHSTDPDRLDADLARHVDAVCRRFEAAWKQGPRPRIEDQLDAVAAPARPALLAELITLERELRSACGERPRPGEYRARFPDLLATNDWDHVLRLWDPETGRQLLGLEGGWESIRFSPDDRHLLLGIGGHLQLLEVAPARAASLWKSREGRISPRSSRSGSGIACWPPRRNPGSGSGTWNSARSGPT